MEVKEDVVVSMHYTLKNNDGQVLDTSDGRDPLQFLYGHGNIISGLEKAIEGKEVGEEVEVSLEPAEAYGERDEGLQQEVDRGDFQGIDDIQVGMRFQAETEQGQIPIRIVEVEGDKITVDGNHELAGERLHFAVSIEDLRDAKPEELEHGHVHGPGGHRH